MTSCQDGGAEARRKFAAARVARLASRTPQGAPHLVPVTFSLEGDTVWWVVDDKPKRTRALARLANIAADPRVSLLVDHYEEDWEALWWVRADGVATLEVEEHEARRALSLLGARYEPYRARPPGGPVVRVDVYRWRWWSATGPASTP